MRSLNLCLSIALLLCLQAYAVDTQELLVGTWSNPEPKVNTGANCCIPESIKIWKSGSDLKGTYSYDASLKDLNGKCIVMFSSAKESRDVKITKKSNSDAYDIGVLLGEGWIDLGSFSDLATVKGYRAKVLSSSQLQIYNPQRPGDKNNAAEAEAETCDFTMNKFVAGSSSSVPNSNTSVPDSGTTFNVPVKYIAIGVAVAFLFLCIACKCRQKKQIVIIQHESAYGSPNMYHPHKLQYGQK